MSTQLLDIPNLRLDAETTPEIQPIIRRKARATRRRRVRRNFRRRALTGVVGGLVIAGLGFGMITTGTGPFSNANAGQLTPIDTTVDR